MDYDTVIYVFNLGSCQMNLILYLTLWRVLDTMTARRFKDTQKQVKRWLNHKTNKKIASMDHDAPTTEVKMEKDCTAETDAALPEAEKLAKVCRGWPCWPDSENRPTLIPSSINQANKLQEAFDILQPVEKLTRGVSVMDINMPCWRMDDLPCTHPASCLHDQCPWSRWEI